MFTERDYLENFLYVFNKFVRKTVECGSLILRSISLKERVGEYLDLDQTFSESF